jgi:NADH:ubiquinone oxidoreductase subunit 6 (subunit J)
MSVAMLGALVIALFAAFASIVVGRNLTHQIAAALVFITAMAFTLLFSGSGFVGLVVVILTALWLGVIQLFGWMLVDVDRDHLPATDRPTFLARAIAFLLLAGGLALLIGSAYSAGDFTPSDRHGLPIDSAGIGRLLFGPLQELVQLLGFLIAGGLLATMLLLQDDEGNN